MWEFQIAGVDLYHILNWLFIYSFLGWVWESCYVSVKEKRLVNRGFVTGPVCTIYGFGAVSVYLILKPVSGNLFWLYLGGVIVPTLLEYITAVLMEHIFHTSWWDYSHNKYNFQEPPWAGGFSPSFCFTAFSRWWIGSWPSIP